jgi:DNA-binding ferritin-like protein (Dps family)
MILNKIVHSLSVRPAFPCGTGAMVALGAGSAIAGLTGTLTTNKSNERINDRQMAFNAIEAQKQRDFQRDEWTRQYNIQRDEWYRQLQAQHEMQMSQFYSQAEYNSPSNQVQRLKAAGMNPSAVLGGQGSSGLVSAATGNVASAPSPAPPSGGSVSGSAASAPSPIPMQSPQVLQNIGSLLRDLAAAGKESALTQPMVELLGQQVISQDLQNQWQAMENDVMSKVKDTKVHQAFADLKNSFADYVVKSALYENYSADTLLKSAEKALKVAQKNLTNEQYEEVAFRVAHQFQTWQADMKLKNSQSKAADASATSSYASARLSIAKAKTEDDIRQFAVRHQELMNNYQSTMNNIAKNDYKVSDATVQYKIDAVSKQLVEQAKREGLLTEQAAAAAEMAIKENNWWLFRNIMMPVEEIIRSQYNIAGDRVMQLGSMILK